MVDLLFCFLGNLQSSGDLITSDLSLSQNINQLIILENGNNFCVFGESLQNTVLNITSGLGGLCILDNDLFLLLLEVGHLNRDELVKHLLFKTKRRNGKVEDANFDLGFRSVVWVGNRGRHEELEIVVPWNRLITESKRT